MGGQPERCNKSDENERERHNKKAAGEKEESAVRECHASWQVGGVLQFDYGKRFSVCSLNKNISIKKR